MDTAVVPIAPEVDTRLVQWHDGRMMVVKEDEWVYDPETGEFMGSLMELNVVPDEPAEVTLEWCNDMVRRRANAFAEQIGFEAQMLMLIEGIRSRYEPKINNSKRKVTWLDSGPMKLVKGFALKAVEKRGKGKSFDFDFGRVAFRKEGGKIEVIDETEAAQFCLTHSPRAVKVQIDLDMVPEEVLPKAVELITLLQNLAVDSISMSVRKSMVFLPDGVHLPVLEPSNYDFPWDIVVNDDNLYEIVVEHNQTVIEGGFETAEEARERMYELLNNKSGMVITPLTAYGQGAVTH